MLTVEEVHTYYDHIHALKGISLHIEEKEIVCLIGSNGAGKSTTLMTINGVIHPSQGRIRFLDLDITTVPPDKIAGLGISQVPEGRRILPRLTVVENLEMGAFLRKDKQGIKRTMQEVFDLFPALASRKRQQGGTLSGGEQQMLAIGRALMAQPKLLLLDEPSLGLAPIIVDKIFEIIQQINKVGTTIFLVEQNANLALNISRRAYVMETGLITLEGPAAELSKNEEVRKAYLGE
ncbi:MAG: ABC transporter ATP-binding protein [Deltaproteobacteria bacterium]|nr:ABC transporter ATP-binding protein [Deltaproteobacteria bacterium]MBW2016761.1 ABC transporter ATP-binding protein [Deltaproteobacteria bacterium]MBW2129307.1 ABC transporter ATP-binding protein [Deltaproteobacteria bacterium]MBW2304212.1 ABC transporter ATP-binding protein [Deltaproteobacteria bacterium]